MNISKKKVRHLLRIRGEVKAKGSQLMKNNKENQRKN